VYIPICMYIRRSSSGLEWASNDSGGVDDGNYRIDNC